MFALAIFSTAVHKLFSFPLSTARLILMVEQETCKYRYRKVATITGVPAPEIMKAHQRYLRELRKGI